MKLLKLFLDIIGVYTFNTINLIYPQRNVYISSYIENEQVYYIERCIDKMNLSRIYDKNEKIPLKFH